jgi:MFS family permease
MFWLFILLRGLVGVGEASYSCVAPTIIADMYKHDMRTTMLALFNIAVPLGR